MYWILYPARLVKRNDRVADKIPIVYPSFYKYDNIFVLFPWRVPTSSVLLSEKQINTSITRGGGGVLHIGMTYITPLPRN